MMKATTYNIKGNAMYGQISFKVLRNGRGIGVYWPAGMDIAPSVVTEEQAEGIKKKYELQEAK